MTVPNGGGAEPLRFDARDELFLDGQPDAMASCYRECFGTVDRAVARFLNDVDRENVVQEVFFRLVSDRALRESFRGGSFAAWLSAVARNHALDYVRRRSRQKDLDPDELAAAAQQSFERQSQARELIGKFRDEVPESWRPVFDARFVQQLTQQEAADVLGISRTTLAYREVRIRHTLNRALRRMERE